MRGNILRYPVYPSAKEFQLFFIGLNLRIYSYGAKKTIHKVKKYQIQTHFSSQLWHNIYELLWHQIINCLHDIMTSGRSTFFCAVKLGTFQCFLQQPYK